MPDSPQIILAGAGHAHLHLLRHARRFRARGAELVLIEPGNFWYSGMATGLLGGQYDAADDCIDIAALAQRCGVRHHAAQLVSVDRANRRCALSNGASLVYHALSLNIGSTVDTGDFGEAPGLWPVKPIANLWRLRQTLEAEFARQRQCPDIAIIGGGPTGSEIAASLLSLCERHGVRPRVQLYTRNARLLPQAPAAAAQRLGRILQTRGATLHFGVDLAGRRDRLLIDRNGNTIAPAEHLILAHGLRANRLTQTLGLPADAVHGLSVGPQLHAPDDPRIFASGDCAHFLPRTLPKLGVFGVRQAPVLLHNLLASTEGTAPRRYQAQRRWLSVLNLGHGRALALWGRFWLCGRLAFRLKHWLDRRFMQRYRGA